MLKGIIAAIFGLGMVTAAPASAAPATDTNAHGGATNDIRESSHNFRDSIHDMPLFEYDPSWPYAPEIRPPHITARPQTTAG